MFKAISYPFELFSSQTPPILSELAKAIALSQDVAELLAPGAARKARWLVGARCAEHLEGF